MIEQTESLSSLLTVFINCFHQSPQNHSLSPNDSLCFTFIIVSRCSLKTDLILLLIIHFTWFHPGRYGNTIPKSYLARLFGILWILIGLVPCSFVWYPVDSNRPCPMLVLHGHKLLLLLLFYEGPDVIIHQRESSLGLKVCILPRQVKIIFYIFWINILPF